MSTLFIVRHAHAVSDEENPERPLSDRGRQQVRALAKFLRRSGAFDVKEIWHSPLARSRETAERLNEHLELRAKLVEIDGIKGDDDPATVAARLKNRRPPLAIVGHEPHLSAFTSLLVAGAAEPVRFKLKKAAVVALEREGPQWKVRWQISPEILK